MKVAAELSLERAAVTWVFTHQEASVDLRFLSPMEVSCILRSVLSAEPPKTSAKLRGHRPVVIAALGR